MAARVRSGKPVTGARRDEDVVLLPVPGLELEPEPWVVAVDPDADDVPRLVHACIDGWNPSLSYKVFAARYKVFERSLKKTSELYKVGSGFHASLRAR